MYKILMKYQNDLSKLEEGSFDDDLRSRYEITTPESITTAITCLKQVLSDLRGLKAWYRIQDDTWTSWSLSRGLKLAGTRYWYSE